MADNPYTTQTIPSSYNQNAPPDDGSEVASNVLEWQKHLDKIGDPLKTFAEGINSANVTAGGKLINIGDDQSNRMTGSLGFGGSELTIAAGVITPTRTRHTVDTQSDASSDELSTMSASSVPNGAIVILSAADDGRTVVVKHDTDEGATGNPRFFLQGDTDFTIDDDEITLILELRTDEWHQIAGGAAAANQSQMEAAAISTVMVTPLNAQWHPGVAKAWLDYDQSGPTLHASHNVDSVTDTGAGDFTVNFTTDFSSARYCVSYGAIHSSSVTLTPYLVETTRAVGSYRAVHRRETTAEDGLINISFFGDQ